MDPSKRIDLLDILRGFALIGIFIVNIHLMRGPDALKISYGFAPAYDGSPQLLSLVTTVFFEGAFISLFTFLFGVGFGMFMRNAKQKQLLAFPLFRRRMTGLLIFGLIHLVFLWLGDILTLYAISGFLLLLFYRRSVRSLFLTGTAFLAAFILLLFSRLAVSDSILFDVKQTGAQQISQSPAVYETAPSIEWLVFRLIYEVPDIVLSNVFLIPFALGMFLIGLAFDRAGVFTNISQFIPKLKRLFVFSLLISIPLMIVLGVVYTGVLSLEYFHGHLVDSLSRTAGIPLAFVYLSGIILLFHYRRLPDLFNQLLSSFGRMALTNYLGQTVLALGILYTFDLYNDISYGRSLLLVFGILLFQIGFSRVWLKRFQQGPLEGVWRSFTYRKPRPDASSARENE
ncbi:DUF418 domain-containing protein [Salisediminibacterium halotolerans]|uniref:DUF418 domain-containing protein n=1 Tax=Salisediminibacterium halotolerans TaxID=517425 RepID=A0A1H9SYY0_9BACI|nr:DUF418 domain-containing protein [Salisediminibacterium haloalkalitolerans]SER89583.1 uncharacterized protein SAMN05444126_10855 [Salisediminibacterium haloalkalitolerans]